MPERIRLAWAVVTTSHEPHDPPSIVFAPTRSAARALAISQMRDAWDCTFMAAARAIRSLRRAPESDVNLPLRHALAAQIDAKLLDIVVHAYGGKQLRAGHRDHFYTRSDDPDLLRLVELGLFQLGPEYDARRGADTVPHRYFLLTETGKLVAAGEQPEYPHA